jgi:murein DD-endopeptidase MepM/ murein hydrolase activator NlpD
MNKKLWPAIGAILAIVASVSLAVPAQADQYSTWQDVQNARANVTARQAEITKINGFIAGLNADLAAAQAMVNQRGQEAADAQGQADAAGLKARELQTKAAAAKKSADESKRQAGIIAASFSRVGGQDLSLAIFTSGDKSDTMLYKLGTMRKLTEVTDSLYAKATADMNTAQSLTDQANVAKQEFMRRSSLAQDALKAAVDAQAAYQAKVDSSVGTLATLNAQLTVLVQNRDATEADYNAGVAARAAAAAAAARAAAAAAAARAAAERAAAAAAAAAAASGSGSSPAGTGGTVSRSGWSNPLRVADQWVSSPYGYRVDPFGSGSYEFHYGTDIAVSCGTATYVAFGGQVTYSGWYGGTLGYVVIVDHGSGIQTLYGHLQSLAVSSGASVASGQNIAQAGSSGASTGCHLYVRVTVGASTVDPQPFMQDRGITLGRP